MDVGAVERLLRSLALEGLGGLEFRVPAEVSRWFFAATRFQLTESHCSESESGAICVEAR